MHRLEVGEVIDHSPREILAAAPDALALALGAPVRSPHPFSDAVAAAPLRTVAIAAGLLNGVRMAGESEAAIIGRGLRTADFSGAVAAGLQAAARRRFDAQAAHLGATGESEIGCVISGGTWDGMRCVRPSIGVVEVQRLGLPESVGGLDLAAPLESVAEGREFKVSNAALRDGETITLNSLGRIIGVSRQAIINDEFGLIQDEVSAMGTAAARHEARLIAAALEANPTLSDGGVVFDAAAYGNVTTAAFDSAGLGAAMGLLRTQKAADGHALDAQAATLIVAPDLELSARQLVYLTGIPLVVVVLTGLATGRYYVTASPAVARNIVVGRLEGMTHPLAVEGLKPPLNFDGAAVRVRIDTAAAMVGRRGIVRGGA